jgi:hypothetical protein
MVKGSQSMSLTRKTIRDFFVIREMRRQELNGHLVAIREPLRSVNDSHAATAYDFIKRVSLDLIDLIRRTRC